jgi:hypothetical protein
VIRFPRDAGIDDLRAQHSRPLSRPELSNLPRQKAGSPLVWLNAPDFDDRILFRLVVLPHEDFHFTMPFNF